MTGLVRKTLAVAAGLTVVASVAMAAVPDPLKSSVEPVIVGGSSAATLVNNGIGANPGFEVTVRDVNNAGIVGASVVIDFSSALAVRLFTNTPQNGATVNCGNNTLTKSTWAGGLVIFGPRMGGFVNAASVQVSANGVVLANIPARSTDIETGDNGAVTNGSDLNTFRCELFNLPCHATGPETDYNNDTLTNTSDLNIFRIQLFATDQPGAGYCH